MKSQINKNYLLENFWPHILLSTLGYKMMTIIICNLCRTPRISYWMLPGKIYAHKVHSRAPQSYASYGLGARTPGLARAARETRPGPRQLLMKLEKPLSSS